MFQAFCALLFLSIGGPIMAKQWLGCEWGWVAQGLLLVWVALSVIVLSDERE